MNHILHGDWWLATDSGNVGQAERWPEAVPADAQPAPVPGVIQQVFPGYHGVAWYWHRFQLPPDASTGERALLHFGAVDYLAEVWLNGHSLGGHEGGETPFELDATASLNRTGDNLLAVRVLNPTNDPIDGVVLKETPHRNKVIPYRAGASFNCGGIMYPVTLRFLPSVALAELAVQPDPATGRIAVAVTVYNATDAAVAGALTGHVSPAAGGDVLVQHAAPASFPPGASHHTFTLTVAQPRAWELDDPYLYRVEVSLTADGGVAHRQSTRCGFRDLRLQDGFFYLNGRRILLKSTHTGNHMPIGQQAPVIADFVRRDLIYAKAAGFNTVRFIAGVAYPEQLDFCDELGLLVWQSTYAGWLLGDSPHMATRFDQSVSEMVRRDRHHASLAIWELLNETHAGPVFRHAVDYLPTLRALDPTRLVLLSSGRWDGDWSIGSASNPGSAVWEPVWGVEGPGAPPPTPQAVMGYFEHAGDAHFYPLVPQSPEVSAQLRRLGHGAKPVLLSEYGIGSLFDVIGEWRQFEQAQARPDLEDAALVRQQSEQLRADWERLGFTSVYPFVEDLLRESQRLHARQRTLGFDLIRANPQLAGYNLTGMLDHGMTGEGLWSFWRRWKPATFDAVTDGWSPLRWCLRAEPMHGYLGQPVEIEAVLATEDALPPGDYPARFRLLGPDGPVWEKAVTLTIPAAAPLAVPVLRETLTLNGPAGEYTLAANLERGGAPTGGRLNFHQTDARALPRLSGNALLWGVDASVADWLHAHGLHGQPLTADAPGQLVLIGVPPDPAADPAAWAALLDRLAQGATLLFLSSALFRTSAAALAWLPLAHPGRCVTFLDWLYHKEGVAQRHPVFAGWQAPGIMDLEYWGPLTPSDLFEDQDTPAETLAAAFATGHHTRPTGYACGLLIARHRHGAGRFILNTPPVLEHLGQHPVADRLLVELVRYAQTLNAA